MAISSLAQRTTTVTATTTANWELRTAAAGRCKLLEWSFINSSAATATSIGLGTFRVSCATEERAREIAAGAPDRFYHREDEPPVALPELPETD